MTPNSQIDYPARLKTLRACMAEKNVGLVYLPPGANLFYSTGVRRQERHGTDSNAYADWVVGGYIGLEGEIILAAARMGGAYYQSEALGKPWLEPVRLVTETENPLDVLRQMTARFDLRGKRVALDDRTWAQTVLDFQRLLPDTEFLLASELFTSMRMIKSPAEIERMCRAGQITDAVFQKALARLQPGVSELDISNEIDYQFKAAGAEYTSFVTGIRFAGPSSDRSTTTERATSKRLQPGDSITFDFGCVLEGYCSDFGRSAFVGDPPPEYTRIHHIVLRAQADAMKAMKAGQVTASEVNAIARRVIEAEGYGQNFTHRLGHGIGITVHEPPFLDVVDNSVLQANMTFTVEPSIRVPNWFSNRVEDVVLVTETGGVSLYNTDRSLYIIG